MNNLEKLIQRVQIRREKMAFVGSDAPLKKSPFYSEKEVLGPKFVSNCICKVGKMNLRCKYV